MYRLEAIQYPQGESEADTVSLVSVLEEIANERGRQVAEGYDAAHDDKHTGGEMAVSGVVYALDALADTTTSEVICRAAEDAAIRFEMEALTLCEHSDCDPRRQLVKAMALLVAEVQRLDRMKTTKAAPPCMEG